MKICEISRDASFPTLADKLNAFWTFMYFDFDGFLKSELIVANEVFSGTSKFPFFQELANKKAELLRFIANAAWDINHFRRALHVASVKMSKANHRNYFFPYFLTRDEGLAEVITVFRLNGAIFSRSTPFYEPLHVNEPTHLSETVLGAERLLELGALRAEKRRKTPRKVPDTRDLMRRVRQMKNLLRAFKSRNERN